MSRSSFLHLLAFILLYRVAGFAVCYSQTSVVNVGLTYSGLSSAWDSNNAAGRRLIDVSGFETPAGTRFCAVWEQRGSPFYWVQWGLSSSGWDSSHAGRLANDYRPVVLERWNESGQERYAGIWEKWNGPTVEIDKGIAMASFASTISTRRASGFRPSRIDVSKSPSGHQVSVVWEQRTGPEWELLTDVDDGAIETAMAGHVLMGFRPVRLVQYESCGNGKVMVLLERRGRLLHRRWFARAGMTEAQMNQEITDRNTLGYEAMSISGFDVNGTATYAAVWRQDDRPSIPAVYPMTGPSVPELASLDMTIVNFMKLREITSANFCVSVNGTIVHERGYGWRDFNLEIPMPPNGIYRLASVSKPITAAAVRKLAADGMLSLSDKVFELGQPGGGWLDISPIGTPDARTSDITVQHLLDHKGGWDTSITGDYVFMQTTVADAAGSNLPPPATDYVRYVLGKTLNHNPGTTYAYSNFGFLCLGLIIEEVTGQDATEWVRTNIMIPSSVAPEDFILGKGLEEDRNPREPYYFDLSRTNNLHRPAEFSSWANGVHNDALESYGGWACSARGLMRFADDYYLNGVPRSTGGVFTFTGSLPGTRTFVRQRSDRIDWALLFNQRAINGQPDYIEVVGLIDAAVDGTSTWPTEDPAVTHQPNLQIVGSDLHWENQVGQIFRVWRSPNLVDWYMHSPETPSVGGGVTTFDISDPMATEEAMFFKIDLQ